MDFLKGFNGRNIPWWLVALLFVFSAPIGVIALILKLFVGGQSTAMNDRSLQQYAPPLQSTQMVDTRINKPKAAPQDGARRVSIPAAPKKLNTAWMKLLAAILAVIGFVTIGDKISMFDLSGILTSVAFLLGGGALGFKAFLSDKDQKRYAAYLPIIGEREAVDVEELSRVSGNPRKRVEKDLQEMLQLNYFGSAAYLNQELGYLFRSSEADSAWQEKHQFDRDAAPQEVSEGYSGILRDIRRANDQIADPALSAKIGQLENLVGRILRVMEENPEKAKRMDTFLTYYLPTTQKLLDSYVRFESAGVEGDNLRQSKQRISETMDMILKGFAYQLDQLYQSDAMDVDSDIRVMETMLRRDTATAADDFGLGGSAAQKAPRDF